MDYQLIIIGSGPGGYVGAIRAAQLGLNVAIIERDEIGGTCLNRGCMPAKAMLESSDLYYGAKEGKSFGIQANDLSIDYGAMIASRDESTANLVKGITALLEANQVTIYRGTGTVLDSHQVQIDGENSQIITGEYILIATGSKPGSLPIEGIDLEGVLNSDALFALEEQPKRLAIIGGGVIGSEFAQIYSQIGTEVTILEAESRLLPTMDREIGQNLKMIFRRRGIKSITRAMVEKIMRDENGLTVYYKDKKGEKTVEADAILVSVGRRPVTDSLFKEDLNPKLEKGFLIVDEDFQTSIPNVYAIGDVIGGMQLAHKASAEAKVVVEKLAGLTPSINLDLIPAGVYTTPEIGTVGLTAQEAKAKKLDYREAKFMMSANGRSTVARADRGFVKLVVDNSTDKILGAHLMCERGTDLIAELTTAMVNNLTVHEMLKSVRPHPSYTEGIGEAFEALKDGAIHMAPKRKRK